MTDVCSESFGVITCLLIVFEKLEGLQRVCFLFICIFKPFAIVESVLSV